MASPKLAIAELLPKWTKRAATDLGGRDPLGLSRVAQMLADGLLPGIITQTDRARYYALYSWILWHLEQEGESEHWDAFVTGFQRREATIALSTLIQDPKSSPVGKRAAEKHLRQAHDRGEANTSFQVLPATTLGGFGQYYGGCLHQLGLTYRSDDGIDRVAPGMGERLARAVNDTVVVTPYVKNRLFTKRTVDLKLLNRSAERLSVDAIADPDAALERSLLTDLFFGFGESAPIQTSARRASLARILWTLKASEEAGFAVSRKSIDDQLLYAPTYFGVLIDSKGRPKKVEFPKQLDWCANEWRQYCLHQFLTQAIEGLLDGLLRLLANHPAGLTVDDIARSLTGFEFQAYLRQVTGDKCDRPSTLMKVFGIATPPDEEFCVRQRNRFGWAHKLSERICERDAARPGQIAARSCLTLASLYSKWRGITSDAAYRDLRSRSGQEVAAHSVLHQLDRWCDRTLAWTDVARLFVIDIARHHDRVMYEKGRLESCWIHQQDGRLVRDQDYQPYYRASRHNQAVQVLADLGLARFVKVGNEPCVRLSAQGKSILSRALRED